MYLLRHGQSYFNLHFNASRVDPGIEDPELTPLGVAQAHAAARQLQDRPLSRLIVSPYLRALQTAAPIAASRQLALEVWQEVRERTAYVCDIGSAPSVLRSKFPEHEFDHLPERWWHPGEEPEAAVVARADEFRARMARAADRDSTLLVSHWAFILALTGISVRNGELIEYDPCNGPPVMIDWDY